MDVKNLSDKQLRDLHASIVEEQTSRAKVSKSVNEEKTKKEREQIDKLIEDFCSKYSNISVNANIAMTIKYPKLKKIEMYLEYFDANSDFNDFCEELGFNGWGSASKDLPSFEKQIINSYLSQSDPFCIDMIRMNDKDMFNKMKQDFLAIRKLVQKLYEKS